MNVLSGMRENRAFLLIYIVPFLDFATTCVTSYTIYIQGFMLIMRGIQNQYSNCNVPGVSLYWSQ